MNAAVAPVLVPERAGRPARGLDVLFVLNNLSLGGSERKTVRLANALASRGARIGIAYLNAPDALRSEVSSQIPVWCLERRGKYSFSATRRLRELLRAHEVATVVSVNSYPALYVIAAARSLRPRPLTVALMNTTSYRSGEAWRRGLYRRVLGLMDCTVYGCEVQRSVWLPREHPLLARSQVIYNGVDVERFQGADREGERARLGIAREQFVFGSVGRLAVEKNQRVLIDVLARMRAAGLDAHLVLVGDGPLRELLVGDAAARGVSSHVTFAGAQSDVRPMLAAMDVFVLPSLVETFSNAALEAMAMGLPVILTRTGGASEMVSASEGVIVDGPDCAAEIANVLSSLQRDRGVRERMGAAARARVRQVFSWEAMVEAYAGLLLRRREAAHG